MAEFCIKCPYCGVAMTVMTEWAGRSAQCPACRQTLLIPAAGAVPPRPEIFAANDRPRRHETEPAVPPRPEPSADNDPRKPCPFCGRWIKREAEICKYCHSRLPALEESDRPSVTIRLIPSRRTLRQLLIPTMFAAGVLLVVWWGKLSAPRPLNFELKAHQLPRLPKLDRRYNFHQGASLQEVKGRGDGTWNARERRYIGKDGVCYCFDAAGRLCAVVMDPAPSADLRAVITELKKRARQNPENYRYDAETGRGVIRWGDLIITFVHKGSPKDFIRLDWINCGRPSAVAPSSDSDRDGTLPIPPQMEHFFPFRFGAPIGEVSAECRSFEYEKDDLYRGVGRDGVARGFSFQNGGLSMITCRVDQDDVVSLAENMARRYGRGTKLEHDGTYALTWKLPQDRITVLIGISSSGCFMTLSPLN